MKFFLRVDPKVLQKADDEIGNVSDSTYKLMVVCMAGMMLFASALGFITAWLYRAITHNDTPSIAIAGVLCVCGFIFLCKPTWFVRFIKR